MVVQSDSHCCFSCSSCAVSNLYYVFNLFTLSLLKLAATVGLVTVCRWYFFYPTPSMWKFIHIRLRKPGLTYLVRNYLCILVNLQKIAGQLYAILSISVLHQKTAPITLEHHYQHNPTNKVGSWLVNIVLHIAAKEPDMTKLNKHY